MRGQDAMFVFACYVIFPLFLWHLTQCFPASFVCAVCSRHFGALPPPIAHRYTQGVSSVSQAQK